jgi:hypothetical protein
LRNIKEGEARGSQREEKIRARRITLNKRIAEKKN